MQKDFCNNIGTQKTVNPAAGGSAYLGAAEACVRGAGQPPMTHCGPQELSRCGAAELTPAANLELIFEQIGMDLIFFTPPPRDDGTSWALASPERH